MFDERRILQVLDECCAAYTFPMLDNGYVYLAATRLSLYRSATNWALVIEVFGFSPRAGFPDTAIHTFASELHARNPVENYVSEEAHANYLANNPFNEMRTIWPLEEGAWQDADDLESLSHDGSEFVLRGRSFPLPSALEYGALGIELSEPPRIGVFEFCRWLAATERDAVFADESERRVSMPPDLRQILQLEHWQHPDLANEEVASDSETFRQLARVLSTGDLAHYKPTKESNTHWSHWPESGAL